MGADPTKEDLPQGLVCLLRLLVGCTACESNQVMLCCDLKLDSGCVDRRPLGRGSQAGQGQLLPVTGPGLPGKIYKTIHG